MRRAVKHSALAMAAALLLVGACGGDDDDTIPMTGNPPTTPTTAAEETAAEGAFPVTIEAANGPVEIAAQPEQIVSLSPTATEMLYAIDAGDQVVAVDEQSDYPEQAPVTDLSGFNPNVESIAEHEPDLVLVEGDDALAALAALEIPVLQLPAAATLEQSYAQIEQLGQATGHATAASDLVEQMQTDIAALAETVPQTFAPVPVYHEVDDQLFTISSGTFLGELYGLAGLANIADGIGADQAYPQISAEQVIAANPDWIFLAYGGDDAVAELKARPGWEQIRAVREDRVVALDPDLASRWGPRTVELLEAIVETTAPSN